MSEAPPDDELRALIAMERSAATDPGPARARLAERLAPLLAPLRPGSPPAPPASGLGGWRLGVAALGTLATGAVLGAAVHAATAPRRVVVQYVDRVVTVTADSGPPSLPVPSAVASEAAISSARPRPERPVTSATSAPSSDEALARERQLIEKARSALARGDTAGALAGVDEHAKAFPRGQLVEAREAIAVQALARAGRAAEARRRAERFRQTFPGSLYSPVVEAAISTIP